MASPKALEQKSVEVKQELKYESDDSDDFFLADASEMFAVRAVAATRAAILERVHKLAGQFCPIYKRMEHRSLTENQELFQGPVVKFTNIKESDVDDEVANSLRSIDGAQGFKEDTGVVLTEDTDPPQAKEDEKSEEHSADDEFELDGEWRDDSYYRSLLGGTNLGGI